MSKREWFLWGFLLVSLWQALYTVSPPVFWAELVFWCSLAAGMALGGAYRRWTRK